MTLTEAEDLRQIVYASRPRKEPIIKPLAGNEHVLMLNDGKYVWNKQDWEQTYLGIVPVQRQEEEVEA
jgi:hypothetical protein